MQSRLRLLFLLCVISCLVFSLLGISSLSRQFDVLDFQNHLVDSKTPATTTTVRLLSNDSVQWEDTNDKHSFEIENLLPPTCGGKKCFFPVKADKEVGYLILQEGWRPGGHGWNVVSKNATTKFNRTWTLANELHEEYNVSTLLLAPPMILKKDNDFIGHLNSDFLNKTHNVRNLLFFGEAMVLQKVRVLPKPNVMLHSYYGGAKADRFLEFIAKSVEDIGSFSRNFLAGLEVTRRILDDDRYTCLYQDFQMVMDYSGIIHHIDLDRCFEPAGEGEWKLKAQEFIGDLEWNFRKAMRLLDSIYTKMHKEKSKAKEIVES